MDYFWSVIIVLSLVGLYLFKKESLSIQYAFQQLTAKYNGTVKCGIINYPQLIFPYQDLIIHVSATPHEDGSFSYAHIKTNQFSEDCIFKIISKPWPTKYTETDKNLKKQKTGIEEIDNKFILRAKHDDYLVALLNCEISDAFVQLDKKYNIEVRYIENNDAATTHDSEKFRFDFHVDQVLTSVEEYQQLIHVTHMLVKQMQKIKR